MDIVYMIFWFMVGLAFCWPIIILVLLSFLFFVEKLLILHAFIWWQVDNKGTTWPKYPKPITDSAIKYLGIIANFLSSPLMGKSKGSPTSTSSYNNDSWDE